MGHRVLPRWGWMIPIHVEVKFRYHLGKLTSLLKSESMATLRQKKSSDVPAVFVALVISPAQLTERLLLGPRKLLEYLAHASA
jgi:hypothetical protein